MILLAVPLLFARTAPGESKGLEHTQRKTHMRMKIRRILRKKSFYRISVRGHRSITGKEGGMVGCEGVITLHIGKEGRMGMVGPEGVVTPCTESRRRNEGMLAAHTLSPFYSVRDHTM